MFILPGLDASSSLSHSSNYRLIYPVLLSAAMSSNEEHTSLRLWCAKGRKYHVCGGSLGCHFTRGVLKLAEGLGWQSGEMG